MKRTLGQDIECPFCSNVFFEGDEVEVYEEEGKLKIFCCGCGANLEVELHNDGKIYM